MFHTRQSDMIVLQIFTRSNMVALCELYMPASSFSFLLEEDRTYSPVPAGAFIPQTAWSCRGSDGVGRGPVVVAGSEADE